jgi:hypothetical protein
MQTIARPHRKVKKATAASPTTTAPTTPAVVEPVAADPKAVDADPNGAAAVHAAS